MMPNRPKIALIIVGVFLILLIVFNGLFFIFNWGEWLCSSCFFENEKLQKTIQFSVVVFLLSTSFLGFGLAKKRGRNQLGWFCACFFFNAWGLLVLWLLPDLHKEKPNGKTRRNIPSKMD